MDQEALLQRILEEISGFSGIRQEEIPNIDLYMDQLTTFMDERLRETTRNPDADKVLTKTMINNYAKNRLLPPPVRKKYTPDHIILLIYIYYYKSMLSIGDIDTLIAPLKERFGQTSSDAPSLREIYAEVLEASHASTDALLADIREKYEASAQRFADVPGAHGEQLRTFAFLSLLCYDVYVRQHVIQKMLDALSDEAAQRKATERERSGKRDKDKKGKGKA